jgi:phosphoheptose isomerase
MDEAIPEAARLITECLGRGGKLMVCGNGGSAADAQHFVAELVGRFILQERKGLAALALTADTAFLTAWSNDVGYDQIFARQVEALGQPGDLLIGISTSGRSRNVVEAFKRAEELNIKRLALVGTDGGDMLALSDVALLVPAWNTQRIQEIQILALHLLCELVEKHINDGELETVLAIEKSNGHSMTYSRLFSLNDPRSER